MANIGDELQNALNETAQETHAKNRWSETFEQDNGSIDDDTIEYLMHGSGKITVNTASLVHRMQNTIGAA